MGCDAVIITPGHLGLSLYMGKAADEALPLRSIIAQDYVNDQYCFREAMRGAN
jgi:hypothetical protein